MPLGNGGFDSSKKGFYLLSRIWAYGIEMKAVKEIG
jgi:hypothetical protein